MLGDNDLGVGEVYEILVDGRSKGRAVYSVIAVFGKKVHKGFILREERDIACYKFDYYDVENRRVSLRDPTRFLLSKKQKDAAERLLRWREL